MNKKYIAAMAVVSALMMSACGDKATEIPLPKTVSGEETVSESEVKEQQKDNAEEKKDVPDDSTSEDAADSRSVYPDSDYAESIDDRLDELTYTRTRGADDKSGDTVDTSIYKDGSKIVKIMQEDHGSDGRIVGEYYYNGDDVAYMSQYRTDVYGIRSEYKVADVSDPEDNYTKALMDTAKKALKDAASDDGRVLLYGYVGDEQGGMIKNVTVNLRNVAGTFNDETTTDGDGYYTFRLPQTEDTYNMTYTYGPDAVSSLNDVHVVPGTPEYSLGKVYVAPVGKGIHDTDTYLLNANAKSPVELKDGEYAVELRTEASGMVLRLVDTDDQSSQMSPVMTFDPSKSETGYVLFVEDGSKLGIDDMSDNMGRSYVNVTIFDKDGIVAAYLVPAGRMGSLWRVCDIDPEGEIAISGLMYTDTKGWN